ncbi:hypothetical protein OIU76_020191 [Salix suchowensis]|nr:hypothetical protein OIU76_020191 [Salix suchowensis]
MRSQSMITTRIHVLVENAGHYTRVVWRKSVRLGCAKQGAIMGGTIITATMIPPAITLTSALTSRDSRVWDANDVYVTNKPCHLANDNKMETMYFRD